MRTHLRLVYYGWLFQWKWVPLQTGHKSIKCLEIVSKLLSFYGITFLLGRTVRVFFNVLPGLWKYRLSNFQGRVTKLDRLLAKILHLRVDMVRTIHNDLLTQWRHISMGEFRTIFFGSNYVLPTTYGPYGFFFLKIDTNF